MKYRLARAVAELNETHEFLMEIAQLSPEKMIEKVESEYPEFIEKIERMDEPPKDASEFLDGFSIWLIARTISRYDDIKQELVHSWFKSDLHRKSTAKARFWTQIDKIISETDFNNK